MDKNSYRRLNIRNLGQAFPQPTRPSPEAKWVALLRFLKNNVRRHGILLTRSLISIIIQDYEWPHAHAVWERKGIQEIPWSWRRTYGNQNFYALAPSTQNLTRKGTQMSKNAHTSWSFYTQQWKPYVLTEKTFSAFRETGVFWLIEGTLKTFGPSQHYRIKGIKGGSSIGSSLCRKTPVSRSTNVSFIKIVRKYTWSNIGIVVQHDIYLKNSYNLNELHLHLNILYNVSPKHQLYIKHYDFFFKYIKDKRKSIG